MDVSNSKKDFSFIDFLIICLKKRTFIFWNTLIVTIAAVIISLLMDKWYTSTVNLLPPKKKGGIFGDIAGFSSTIKDLSKSLGRLGSTSEEAFNYLAILESRTTSERMIEKFQLFQIYEFKGNTPIEDVMKELDNHVNFKVEDEGNIKISVSDKNPGRAAEMANYYVDILNDISIYLNTKESKTYREFIERRYIQLEEDIKRTEESLKIFATEYQIYSIDEQTKVAIKGYAELQSQIEIADVELEVVKQNMGQNHPYAQLIKLKIDQLNQKLKRMKFGNNYQNNSQDTELFLPFKEIPHVGIQYLRLMRDYEIQNKFMEFLLPIYEQAKIEEKKDLPVVLVLDKAVPAQRKSSPKRMIIVLVAFILSLFFSIVYALLTHYYENLIENKDEYHKIKEGIILPLRKFFFLRN